ncbi:hypothetical protein [Geomonas ferrireducens]|uniref:hypothetical protein n=1 Tax=Geomonas ferrireducens TaxID=2570227 RepID=UPI0010A8F749|nr:hypothetical protein [Geomonas ferrireducens]
MCRGIIGCYIFLSFLLTGCGLAVRYPRECSYEMPSTGIHDFFGVGTPKASTKSEFLKEWGKPDEVINGADGKDTWVYRGKMWCGPIPVFILPVPLLLPLCDRFDRITFNGERGESLHTRKGNFFYIIIPLAAGDDPPCRCPVTVAPSYAGKSAPDSSALVVLYQTGLSLPNLYTMVYLDGHYVAAFRGSTCYAFLTPPGKREFTIGSEPRTRCTFTLEAGHSYYVRVNRNVFSKTDFEMVGPVEGKNETAGCTVLGPP